MSVHGRAPSLLLVIAALGGTAPLHAQAIEGPTSRYLLGAAAEYVRQREFTTIPNDSLGVDPRRFVRSREPVTEELLTTSSRTGIARSGAIVFQSLENARACDRSVNPTLCGWTVLAQFSEPEVTRDSAYVVVNIRARLPSSGGRVALMGEMLGLRLVRSGDLWSVVGVTWLGGS